MPKSSNKQKYSSPLLRKVMNTRKDIIKAIKTKDNYKTGQKIAKIAAKSTTQNNKVQAIFGNHALQTMSMSRPLEKISRMVLPACTLKYALAVSDPFDPAARGACVPTSANPTQKVHAFIRTDVTIGTLGIGWILITPSLANDTPSIYTTQSGYTGQVCNVLSANNTLNVGVSRQTHNGPYSAASFVVNNAVTNNVYGRIVSAGCRIQYTGTTLNESGLFYCLQEPDHNSVAGASVTDISRYDSADIHAVSRDPCMINTYANDDQETQLVEATSTTLNAVYPFCQARSGFNIGFNGTGNFTDTVSGVSVGAPVSVIMFTGVTGQTFHVEYIAHMEYAGPAASALTTAVDSDPAGTFKVITAAKTIPEKKLDRPKLSNWTAMYEALGEIAHKAAPIVVPAAQTALHALLI